VVSYVIGRMGQVSRTLRCVLCSAVCLRSVVPDAVLVGGSAAACVLATATSSTTTMFWPTSSTATRGCVDVGSSQAVCYILWPPVSALSPAVGDPRTR